MIQIVRFIAVLVVLSTVPYAYSITVDEAVNQALKKNPDINTLRVEEELAKSQLDKARLFLIANPTVEGAFSKEEKPAGEGEGKFTNYGVKLSQEFEIVGQRGLRIDIAEKEILRVRLEIRDKERTLAGDVKDVFAKALSAKMKEALADETVRIQEELLAFTKMKFQAGDVSGLAVNLAEVELSKAKKDFLLSKRAYQEALLVLQGVVGLKPAAAFNIEGELMSHPFVLPDKDDLKKRMAIQRTDLKAATAETEKWKTAEKLAGRSALPNVTLSGFYNRYEERNETGLMLSFPIPLIDRKQAEKREAKARTEQATIKYAGLENSIVKEFEEAYGNLASALEEASIYKEEILRKVTENLKMMNLAFKEGKISFFEVRVAQKDTIETEFAYLDSQLRTRLAINALERVVGGNLK